MKPLTDLPFISECDRAIHLSMDPEVKQVLDDMNRDELKRAKIVAQRTQLDTAELTHKSFVAKWFSRGGHVMGAIDRGHGLYVSSLVSGPTTHVKNVVNTSLFAYGVRTYETAWSVAIRGLMPGEKASWHEVHSLTRGMMAGGRDGFELLGAIAKEAKARREVPNMVTMQRAMLRSEYPVDMALHSKADILSTESRTPGLNQLLLTETGEWRPEVLRGGLEHALETGFKYLEAIEGIGKSPLTALAYEDMVAKFASYRATIQRALSQEGTNKGLVGAALDRYVQQGWEETAMQVRNRNYMLRTGLSEGEELPELPGIVHTAMEDARRFTYTQDPQTDIGAFVAGYWPGSNVHLPMNVPLMRWVTPFRQIYVNMARQSISKRLLPFIDTKTRAQLFSKNKAEQADAIGRTAAAWTLVGATAAIMHELGIELFAPDTMQQASPAYKELAFQAEGRLGGTIKIGDLYLPIDVLPDSVTLPLVIFQLGMDAMETASYYYSTNPEEDRMKITLRAMAPFLQMATSENWLTQYVDFMTQASKALLGINSPDYVIKELVQIGQKMTTPKALADWTATQFPYVKRADWYNVWKSAFATDYSSTAVKRSVFGQALPLRKKFGFNPAYYDPRDPEGEVPEFLTSINFDKDLPRNVKEAIGGVADTAQFKMLREGYDTHDLSAEELDYFEYYVGTIENENGDDFFEYVQKLKDSKFVRDAYNSTEIRNEIKHELEKRRELARQIMQFHPQFQIWEHQTALLAEGLASAGVDKNDIARIVRDRERAAEITRREFSTYYKN